VIRYAFLFVIDFSTVVGSMPICHRCVCILFWVPVVRIDPPSQDVIFWVMIDRTVVFRCIQARWTKLSIY
jgi:hypothetical protein